MEKEPEFKCRAEINLRGDPKTLDIAISPENATMPGNATCTTIIEKEGIKVEIKGKMTLGRLKYTVDDVLKAAALAQNIERNLSEDT
ncbi:MAG: hypothetical protein D6732_03430 [Methanobacteriota archaeon]|nr:MAG: hypothetical protein D6732_03430 [Euryarchaeota archaeon]